MTDVTFTYTALTDDQQDTVAGLWHDALDPADFRYSLDRGGNVIGRKQVASSAAQVHQLPKPVSSSRKAPKPLTLKQIQRELAFPNTKRRHATFPRLIIGAIALAIYEGQRRKING